MPTWPEVARWLAEQQTGKSDQERQLLEHLAGMAQDKQPTQKLRLRDMPVHIPWDVWADGGKVWFEDGAYEPIGRAPKTARRIAAFIHNAAIDAEAQAEEATLMQMRLENKEARCHGQWPDCEHDVADHEHIKDLVEDGMREEVARNCLGWCGAHCPHCQ